MPTPHRTSIPAQPSPVEAPAPSVEYLAGGPVGALHHKLSTQFSGQHNLAEHLSWSEQLIRGFSRALGPVLFFAAVYGLIRLAF